MSIAIGILSLIVSVVVGLFKLYFALNKPEPRTPTDDLADHFDALDRRDQATFARRRRRHLGDLLSGGMRRNDADGP